MPDQGRWLTFSDPELHNALQELWSDGIDIQRAIHLLTAPTDLRSAAAAYTKAAARAVAAVHGALAVAGLKHLEKAWSVGKVRFDWEARRFRITTSNSVSTAPIRETTYWDVFPIGAAEVIDNPFDRATQLGFISLEQVAAGNSTRLHSRVRTRLVERHQDSGGTILR